MRPITFISQLILLVMPAVVSAQGCSTSTERSCSTRMAMVPNWWPVGTSVRTSTAPVITGTDGATTTVTSTTTVAALPLTATVSTTAVVTSTTTASPKTNTVFSTSTVFSTTSITTTSTRTGVVTSTVISTESILQTSLIPAPTNFMNAYDSTGDRTYEGAKRNIGRRRDLAARLEHQKRGKLADLLKSILNGIPSLQTGPKKPNTTKKRISLKSFDNPISVVCTVTIQKYCGGATRTATAMVTSTAQPTTTTTTLTSTITSISTKVPPAVTVTMFSRTITSTLTQITTVAVGATSTLTSTSTTSISSTTTVYAACATDNMLGARIQNGNAIKKTYFYDDKAVVVTSAESSAYDCCVACQTSNLCQFYQYSGSTGTCFVTGQNANWCTNNQQDAGWPAVFVWDDPAKVSDALVIGNGMCGITMDMGQDQGS